MHSHYSAQPLFFDNIQKKRYQNSWNRCFCLLPKKVICGYVGDVTEMGGEMEGEREKREGRDKKRAKKRRQYQFPFLWQRATNSSLIMKDTLVSVCDICVCTYAVVCNGAGKQTVRNLSKNPTDLT